MISHLKKGDTVILLAGADKGKKGAVLKVYPKDNMVLVEGINMKEKHQRARQSNKKGQKVSIPHPVHASNVSKGGTTKKASKKK
jgi:large subunit ribosomal protein L24